MKHLTASCCLFVILLSGAYSQKTTYKARVLDYTPYEETTQKETLHKNADAYVGMIATAFSLDIMVFPEYGLTGFDIIENVNINLTDSTVIVPPASKEELCDKEHIDLVISKLSCQIKRQKFYAVVNLLERSATDGLIYNTNVVFDRNGAILAKYRKINLYDTENALLARGSDIVTFETDFGAVFGVFTCFDILFQNPATDIFKHSNVTDIVFPTAWISTIPFYHALSVQDGYAKKNGVNLLASGFSAPAKSSGGSGIYQPGKKNNVYLPTSRGMKPLNDEVEMLDRRMPSVVCNAQISPRIFGNQSNTQSFVTQPIVNATTYIHKNIVQGTPVQTHFEEELCQGELCCKFTIDFDSTVAEISEIYKVIVSDTNCGLVACDNDDIKSCGSRSMKLQQAFFKSITINAKLDDRVYHYMPTSSDVELMPFKYTFCDTETGVELKAIDQNGVIFLGIITPMSSTAGLKVSLSMWTFLGVLALVMQKLFA